MFQLGNAVYYGLILGDITEVRIRALFTEHSKT